MEFDPVGGGGAGDVPDDLGRSLVAAELLGVRLDHRLHDAGCSAGIELEWPIDDVDAADIAALCDVGEGRFEASLADVAPGTHDVGPDLHAHTCHDRTDVRSRHASER